VATDEKFPDHKEIVTSRVKTIRLMTGLTRLEFAELGISQNTIQAWEQGKTKLTEKGAKRLIEAALKTGVICSMDWLLQGKGSAPFFSKKNSQFNSTQYEVINKNLSSEILDIESFKNNNPNSIVFNVTDDSMLPFYRLGDYVGGKRYKGNYIDLHGVNCIISCFDFGIFIRKLICSKGSFFFVATNLESTANNLVLEKEKIDFLAPIIWHRIMISLKFSE